MIRLCSSFLRSCGMAAAAVVSAVVLNLAAAEPQRDGELAPFLGEPQFTTQKLFDGERFPNVVVARDGTVLATWGSRRVRVRRSEDGGETWGPAIGVGDGIHGGGTIVCEPRGDVLLFVHPEHPPRDGTTAPRTVYRSVDHGKTWQQAEAEFHPDSRDFVPSLHMSECGTTLAHGPHAGRLIRPARVYRTSPDRYCTVIYSDDGGRNWLAGEPFPVKGTGEGALVELSTGRLVYTARLSLFPEGEPFRHERLFAFSDDGGRTWHDAAFANVVPDGPRYRGAERRGANYNGHFGMFAGFVRLPVEGRDILLYSNADHDGHERIRMTVWASFDGGRTWPVKRLVHEGLSAYSSLAAGRPGTPSEGWIYLEFEHGEEGVQYAGCTIARFNLAWLLDGEATGDGRVPEWLTAAAPPASGNEARDDSGHDSKLVLVEEGASRAPIVVFEGAPPMTRRAADELAEYIEKTSGAKPEVIEGRPDPLPASAIWVGYQPVLNELFPDLDFDFRHPEEILIAADGKHLVIAGRDRWDPDHLEVEGINEPIVGKQQEYGTVNAVYTFLHDHLGVRWLWPGELGEDVVRQETIEVPPLRVRYHPQIRSRGGAFNFSRLSNRGYGRAHTWTRLQRLQLHSLDMEGGHGFSDWWERYHESHPDIFALQPDGTRSGFPNPRTVKLCQSNPKVWELWLKGVEEKLARDPTRTTFSASPNDGWMSGHCVCEGCAAWDHPDGEPRMFHWQGHREERPALTDRHITFANRLADLLRERYPDRDCSVLMISYGHSRPAPVVARPAENVIMVSVANFYGRTHLVDRGSTRGTTHREQFEAWGKLTPRLMWRPNTGSPAGWQQGLPDLSIAQTAEDVKFVAERGCMGIFIDAVWEHWATQGPQYYVMAQLIWDPSRDAEAVLDDYYTRGFGPAAEHVRAYFELLEQARMAHVEEHGYEAGVLNLPVLYSDDLLRRAGDHLRHAAAVVADDGGVYRDRVAFVAAGLAFTRLVVENSALMQGYWAEPDEAVARCVRDNWQQMERICQEHPYAVHWGPVRPTTPRMLGLHPDHPNPKWRIRPKPKQSRQEPDDLDQN